MKIRLYLLFSLFALTFLVSEGKPEVSGDRSVTLFYAASTGDLVVEIAALFESETGIEVKMNPASSGTLAKQIAQGAPADLYISASFLWMNYLKEEGLLEMSRSFVRNSLVLIAPVDSGLKEMKVDSFLDLPSMFQGRISLGDPAHVPAGSYARESLEYFHWYGELEKRILPGSDVRAALSVVEMGECDLGIVYFTDALRSEKVKMVGLFPEESHSPVEYSLGLLKDSSSEGEAFYRFLKEDVRVLELYRKYGFIPIL